MLFVWLKSPERAQRAPGHWLEWLKIPEDNIKQDFSVIVYNETWLQNICLII